MRGKVEKYGGVGDMFLMCGLRWEGALASQHRLFSFFSSAILSLFSSFFFFLFFPSDFSSSRFSKRILMWR